ncbi:FAD-binding oxidoreductase [Nigerium massiliense]|uniref:FAD-binding oxidoreductase n=1 Tax=Nigerium massiliense TaxID=1522317 RepID=UPI00058F9AAB|nr:FAD-binding oxidoreductase [Nigerium massiliense]
MAPDVKHQKWWGWGIEGIPSFNYANKPAFAPFVREHIGLDLDTAPVVPHPDFAELDVPQPRISDDDLAAVRGIVGDDNAVTDDEIRIIHWAGRSVRDLIRTRAGDFTRVPDVIAYPGSDEEVQALLAAAVERDWVVIPFGGGTSISGSLNAEDDEQRTVVTVDMGRMNKLLDVDEHSGLARVQAGILGPDLDAALEARGLTMGHVPDSFTYSTLGGWAATRSSGMQSDKYGDIADMVRGLRMARPDGMVTLRDLPSTSSGPSVREMILGSEGRLGIITDVTIQVSPLPEHREVIAYMFPTWDVALRCMHDIARSEVHPTFARISDAAETGFSLATQKAPTSAIKKVSAFGQEKLWDFLRLRGWDTDAMCLSYVCYEGSPKRIAEDKKAVKELVGRHGGIVLGSGPGALYDQKKFDTPYLRDFLLDRGTVGDVSETAAPWSKLAEVHRRVREEAQEAFDRIGRQGFVMCHMSHSYHSGACLYFTFAFTLGDEDKALADYDEVKSSIQQAFMDAGSTLSHHHGVGTEHKPWMAQDLSPAGVDLMKGLFREADPAGNLNPGKVIDVEKR